MAWYVALASNQRETGCHSLLHLASYSVWCTHLLNLYDFPMLCKWSITITLGTWNFSSTLAALRTSSSRTWDCPLRVSSRRPTGTSATNTCRCVGSENYSPRRIRRLDAVVGKPTLISWIREGTIWFDIVIFSCLYSNNDWYVCTSHLHWPRTMLSGHVTRSFAYQWSPLYIRHKNRQVLLWLPYRMECDKKTRDKFWKKLQSNAWRKIYGL